MGKYTKAVGTKFNEDGSLRAFPGNTIIASCLEVEPLFTELVWAQNQYKLLPFQNKFSFLPPSSFHMTVIDLVCDQVRDAAHWSTHIPLDAPISDVDKSLEDRLIDVRFPEEITMEAVKSFMGLVIGVRLRPADKANAALLADFRNQVAEATGVRLPTHDTYKFHISLAYNLEKLTAEETEAFESLRERVSDRLRQTTRHFTLPRPQFTMFDDMGSFHRQLTRAS